MWLAIRFKEGDLCDRPWQQHEESSGLVGFQRINCFPHFINNVVKAACKIDYIKASLKSCSKLVRYMKISGHNNELGKSVKSAGNTRFNSNLTMVDSIIGNWESLNRILERENETSRLDDIDLSVLNQIKSFLVPFKHWSDYTESSKKASMYAVWIGIDSLIKHCTVKADDEHLTAMMKTKALSYIEKSFELHKFHRISTFLHPNFKSMRFASPYLIQHTIDETKQMLQSYSAPDDNAAAGLQVERRSSSSSISTIDSEISNYFNESVDEDEVDKYVRLNFTSETQIEPAVWWNERKHDFPQLSRLAIAVHGIPASSTPAERCFSLSGGIITEKRVNIDPNAVENLLIIRSDSRKFNENSIWD